MQEPDHIHKSFITNKGLYCDFRKIAYRIYMKFNTQGVSTNFGLMDVVLAPKNEFNMIRWNIQNKIYL